MPAEAERRLAQFAARVADARRARVGGGVVGLGVPGRRPRRRDRRRAARLDGHAPERDGRRGDRSLVLRPEAAAQPDRLRGGALPVGAVRPAGVGAVRCRRRRLSRRRGGDRGDRRADAARPGLARALQVGRDPAGRGDRGEGALDGRPRVPRRVPVGGRGAARRDCARDRVLRRRLGEVAVRRAGRRLAVCAPGPGGAARAGLRRLAGRMRGRLRSRRRWRPRRVRHGFSPVRRSSPRTTRRARATRSSRRSASIGFARTRCGRRRCSSSWSTTPASS